MLNLMIKRFWMLLALAVLIPGLSFGQDDPVLFSVDGKPVQQSEFVYIYSKTNGKKADFSEASLEEYLDLYVKFKLKVAKARAMQLDTVPELMTELNGYRRQLADSYLIDKEVTEKLIEEAYERSKQDVDISHILVSVKPDATPEEIAAAKGKLERAMKRIQEGEDFETVARSVSDDQSAKNNGGRIGYVTVLFPNGFYELEKAAYKVPVGKLSGPIRTDAGFHALLVHDRRPSRGEVEAAHILLRTDGDRNEKAVKARIDSAYQALEAGADFDALAKAVSEDSRTAAKGGYIGFFGINRFSREFEEAAFGMKEEGTYSKPVKTSVGWHILKLISRRGIQPYNIERGRLENAIKKDNRFEQAKAAMVARIKDEAGLKAYPEALGSFTESLTDTFLTFRWRAPETPSQKVLFQYGDDFKVTVGDFADYLERSSRERIRMGRGKDVASAVTTLYENYLDESAMRYEEKQLEQKYPDFKALMREYEEGILLFEATKQLVWDKASQDTVGLEKFYETVKGKYRYGNRAETSIYRVSNELKDQMEEVRAFIAENTPEAVLGKYNDPDATFPLITHESKKLDKALYPEFKSMEWTAGAISQSEPNPQAQKFKITKIETLLEPRLKTLNEARGYVVADYQDYLEEQWVQELRETYEVDINRKVFKKLIKK
ncbi:MAG: peptidylprolyl isomerase [Phaeodactylibacter sp.]|uniref:peptidylprolyl isomerase n=1 Tax=Phaeodactylibacter sp. TaxID=1940289 RepID=UPI0032EB924A